MRTGYYCCLIVLGMLSPRLCLAQEGTVPGAGAEPRAEREMQEDVEVLRRIVTESVQEAYHRAEERAARTCTMCHLVQEPLMGAFFAISEKPHAPQGRFWDAMDGHALERIHARRPSAETRITSLASYVPGQGIIVQMEAPAPVVDRDVKAFLAADEAAPKRWEMLLREARGEPEKNPPVKPLLLAPQHRRVHRLILTEKVVETLAENGRNLRQLAPDERVTIAFTFRPPSREEREAQRTSLLRHYFPDVSSEAPGMTSGASGAGMAPADGGASGYGPGGSGYGPGAAGAGQRGSGAAGAGGRGVGPGGAGRKAGGYPGAGKSGSGGELSRDSYLGAGGAGAAGAGAGFGSGAAGAGAPTSAVTGDLLLRQERYAEAIAAYEKAMKESLGIDPAERKAPLPADAAEVVRKLVQAHVGAKNHSDAAILLQWLQASQSSSNDETQALRRIYLDLTGTLPSPNDVKAYLVDTRPNRRELLVDRLLAETEGESPARVPARMVISCTRKQLDEVASGKLSKLDFAGKVTLKYYQALPMDTKKDEAKKN